MDSGLKSLKSKTYAEAIATLLKGKLVEVYLGDSFEQVNYADNSQTVSSVLIGNVVDGVGDCLVLDCQYVDHRAKKIKNGNLIFVNSYNIHAITELNGNGTMKEVLVSMNQSADHQPGGKFGNE